MNFSAKINFSGMTNQFKQLKFELQDRVFKQAAEASGEVYAQAYRSSIHTHNPPGTFINAAQQRQYFQNLAEAISVKVRLFADKTGAYAIVGVTSAPGTRKPVAPQSEWIESGTDERFHKDESPTGKVTAQHLLAKAVAEQGANAQAAAVAVIVAGVKRVFGN